MNYVSAVYGVVIAIVLTDWFVRGRHEYRGQASRRKEIGELKGGVLEGKEGRVFG